jgi:hypothetical protein
MGDFVMIVTGDVQVKAPDFYRIAFSACGETFRITNSGPVNIRFERKDNRLTFRPGDLPAKQVILKENHQNEPFKIGVRCVSSKNYAGQSDFFIRSLKIVGKSVLRDG